MVADNPNGKRPEHLRQVVPAPQPAHQFGFGQRVIADGDACNKMVVVGALYRAEGAAEFQCAYWCNGDHKDVWIPAWRLSAAPEFS